MKQQNMQNFIPNNPSGIDAETKEELFPQVFYDTYKDTLEALIRNIILPAYQRNNIQPMPLAPNDTQKRYAAKCVYLLGIPKGDKGAFKYGELLRLLYDKKNGGLEYLRKGVESLITSAAEAKMTTDKSLMKMTKGGLQQDVLDYRHEKRVLDSEIRKRREYNEELSVEIVKLEQEYNKKKEEYISKIQQLKKEVDDLNGEKKELRTDIKELEMSLQEQVKKAPVKEETKKESNKDSDSISVNKASYEKMLSNYEILKKNNTKLKEMVGKRDAALAKATQNLEKVNEKAEKTAEELKSYKESEEYFIEGIQKSYNAYFNSGRASTLHKKKIEKAFDALIYDESLSNNKVGKEAGLSHTSVKSLRTAGFSNIVSLKKVKSVLSAMSRGNWSEEHRAILDKYISMYDKKIAVLDKMANRKMANVITSMTTLPEAHEMYLEAENKSKRKKEAEEQARREAQA